MKVKQLKLYNKYKNIDYTTIEFIYIGIDDDFEHWFLFNTEIYPILISHLKLYGFDPDKIVNDLNLETFINKDGEKCIKGYSWEIYSKEDTEKYFKPILKDKLKNIINR
jgi:hypothetical protein